jgi:sugar phosphate isomerase/epimerase
VQHQQLRCRPEAVLGHAPLRVDGELDGRRWWSRLSRILSLSAATLRSVPRHEAIDAAARAGFNAVGLRLDVDPPTPQELRTVKTALAATGTQVLDIEVARLSRVWDLDFEQRLVDWAAELGARFLLVVSDDADRSRTADALARVATRCRAAGLAAVLEFMRFTYPSTLADAAALALEVGPSLGGVLVDALHLQRSGSHPRALRRFDPSLFPYAQLCDAPAQVADESTVALIREARHLRRLPGDGGLPLRELIAELPPEAPLSIEVQSDEMEARQSAEERADRCHFAITNLLVPD